MMMSVNISFIITSYNYGNFIEEAILSCLNQEETDLNFEIIIIDDGSTDNTHKILNNFKHKKIRIYNLQNQGVEKAANLGFSMAKGDYVIRLDADDFLENNYLREIKPFLQKKPLFFYSDYTQVDENSNVLKNIKLPKYSKKEIFCRGDFLATGTVFPIKLIKKFGSYNTIYKNYGLENFEFILMLINNNINGFHINKSLFCYRRHTKNLSISNKKDIIKYGNEIMKKYNCKYITNKFHPYELKLK